MTPINVRKRRRTAFGMVAGLALATTALVASQPASAATVVGGSIDWGVRASFRSYITGPIAHGAITTEGGATQQSSNGIFQFPITAGNHEASAASASTSGAVHFSGHEGILQVDVSDVRVAINGNAGSIIADVTSRQFISTTEAGPLVNYDDVALVSFDLTGVTPSVTATTVTYPAVATNLTADGAPAFADFYPAGDPFDPVSITLQLGSGGQPQPPTAPRTVAEGSLRWIGSQYLWTFNSVAQCRRAVAPAAFSQVGADGLNPVGAWDDPASGVVFPAVATGSYDAATGATTLQLGGNVAFGNASQGNYRIRLADPVIEIDAAGNGVLRADVDYSTNAMTGETTTGGNCNNNADRVWSDLADGVVVVRFTANLVDRVVDGDTVTWTFTPPWADADPANSFDQELLDALAPATPSLLAHFRASGSGNDPIKPAAPIRLTLQLAPPPPSDSVELIVEVPETDGTLAINVVNDSVDLGDLELAPNGQYLATSGQLGTVTVIDTRTATAPGWNVNAYLTSFIGEDGAVIPANGLGWTPKVLPGSAPSVTAGATVAAGGGGISGAPLGGAAPGQGLGTSSFDADLELHAPTETPPGEYTAVLTLTAI